MDSEVKAQNIALNQFCKRMNEQYHAYAVRCGLSDPALWVLYSLWEADTILTQNDICSLWMYPKQTINFTISGLVKKGLVQLEAAARSPQRQSCAADGSGRGLLPQGDHPAADGRGAQPFAAGRFRPQDAGCSERKTVHLF